MKEKCTLIDRFNLKREMYAKGIKMPKLAEIIGTSRPQTYKKVNGEIPFREDEILRLIQEFGTCIFFASAISQNEKGEKRE